ncbi:MAG: YhcH/YjgK/YiaL family protein [bacterium]
MVLDNIKNYRSYPGFGERIAAALQYLADTDFLNLSPGRYNIDEDNIFALVSEYQSKEEAEGKLEAHRKYIDVQYVVSGQERIGYTPHIDNEVIEEYNEEKDFALYKGDVSFLRMRVGMFAIFYPQDLHMPGIELDGKSGVKKVVVKVKV